MNKNDLRYQKTEEAILKSFSECIDEVGFEGTTVALICKKSRISRNTFYLHYDDKYDLLDTLFEKLQEKLYSSLNNEALADIFKGNFRDAVAWNFNSLSENREMLRLLFKCSKAKVSDFLKYTFIERPLDNEIENYSKYKDDIELALIRTYYSDAMVGYIEVWLNNYDLIPQEKVIDIMLTICDTPIKTFYKILLNKKDAKIKPQYR